ncbi:disintegrin and metalloproteinase domain-containing protein 20-like [Molossus nigricans]
MLPAHPILLSPMAVYGGTIVAMGEALVHVRNTPLPLWLGVFLFQYGWPLVVHSQRHGPPEVVIPLKVTGTGIGMKPQGWLSYTMHFGGQRHIVHMKVNKLLLSKHLPVFTYTDQGAILMEQPFAQNDCYYHGYVEGDLESLVALNTCFGGFQGVIQTNNMVYEIEPKRLSTTFEHFVYKMDSEQTQPMRCGLTDEEIAQQLKHQESVNFTLTQSGYEGWWTHWRFYEVAVVVDHNLYLYHKNNISRMQYLLVNVFNIADSLFRQLNIELILTGIEIWNEGNPIEIVEIQMTLDSFCKWKRPSYNKRVHHDATVLLVRSTFKNALTTLGSISSVCDPDSKCAVVSYMSDDLFHSAFLVTHATSHPLGMSHDGDNCKCSRGPYIMSGISSRNGRFSNCSYNDFINDIKHRTCVNLPPDPKHLIIYKRCGNGVVEEEEECDCGTLDLCLRDRCCEFDCSLNIDAACAFGRCCKNCQFLPYGTVCRQEKNECDLPEWCNGTSHICPEDVYVQNGMPCEGGGNCYENRCNSREKQCRKIFGKEAKNANLTCYTNINTRGDRFGHCGLTASGYIKCNLSDILCGRIQCENVMEIPLLSDHSTVHWTHFNGAVCWSTDYHHGTPILDIGDVKDGTECGAEHVCIKSKCVSRSSLSSLLTNCSSKNCNMHGICNNRQNCHCYRGWEPPKCVKQGFGGSIDSGPPPKIKMKRKEKEKSLLLSRNMNVPPIPEEKEVNLDTLPKKVKQDVPISLKQKK